jgi:hypothetical protein
LVEFANYLIQRYLDNTDVAEHLESYAHSEGLSPLPPDPDSLWDRETLLLLADGRRVVMVDSSFSFGYKAIVQDPEED